MTTGPGPQTQTLAQAARHGLVRGGRTFLWLIKILLPISFLTALLDWSGWLGRIDFILEPAMGWLSLPPEAALPLLIGTLSGIYGGLAAMAVLPFNQGQLTLMAIFLLIAHTLPQEGIIQAKSGLNIFSSILIRLVAAVAAVLICALFVDTTGPVLGLDQAAGPGTALPLASMLSAWSLATAKLLAKLLAIILGILTLMEVLKSLGWVDRFALALAPLLWGLGLSRRVGFLWSVGAVFGLFYGSAVIVEEARQGKLSPKELEQLQASLGINHAMFEDPLLFVPLGIGLFWLWIPRLVASLVAVRLYTLIRTLRR